MAFERAHAWWVVTRGDLLLATFAHPLVGVALAANDLSGIPLELTALYVLTHLALATLACVANSIADRDVDRHTKAHRAAAVDSLGPEVLWHGMVLLAAGAAAGITALFALGHFVPAGLALLGLGTAAGYSLEPLRIKRRGPLSPLPIFAGLYVLPPLGGWFLLRSDLPLFLPLFLLGWAFLNQGFTLVNMAEDHDADAALGIRTWSHLLGLRRTMNLAWGLAFGGGFLALAALALKVPTLPDIGSWTFALFVLIYVYLLWAAVREILELSAEEDLAGAAQRGGRRLQWWFLSTRYPLLVAMLALLA